MPATKGIIDESGNRPENTGQREAKDRRLGLGGAMTVKQSWTSISFGIDRSLFRPPIVNFGICQARLKD